MSGRLTAQSSKHVSPNPPLVTHSNSPLPGTMAPSWRNLAGARLSNVKSAYEQLRSNPNVPRSASGWRQWATERLRQRSMDQTARATVEKVSLFPGWAVRRPTSHREDEFDVEIHVSGFSSSLRPPEFATRSQKAFMRLARSYAALPRLPQLGASNERQEVIVNAPEKAIPDRAAGDLSLPPPPSEMTEDKEIEALERSFQRMNRETNSDTDTASILTSTTEDSMTAAGADVLPSVDSNSGSALHGLHANFESRIKPFWSNAVPNRLVRLSVYASPPRMDGSIPDDLAEADITDVVDDEMSAPILTKNVITNQDGAFSTRLVLPWEQMCTTASALGIAFGDHDVEHQLYVLAELAPSPNPDVDSGSPTGLVEVAATVRSLIVVPLSHSQVRLISDIDDTVKRTAVMEGARNVFYNVFVKHLSEVTIPGIDVWYNELYRRGVRFHYVSNAPYELLPVLSDFLSVSKLPYGSLKLRSYGGRSLFNGLMASPASRKRDGVLDILNAFKSSSFFLVGDTGEQDLELYAQLARERRAQILAIFVRDARGAGAEPLDDPTGSRALQLRQTPKEFSRPGEVLDSRQGALPSSFFDADFPAGSQLTYSTSREEIRLDNMTIAQKRRYDLQMRVYQARSIMPEDIPLRIFQEPEECIEQWSILEKR